MKHVCNACGHNRFRTVDKRNRLFKCCKCLTEVTGSQHHEPPQSPAKPVDPEGFLPIPPKDAGIVAIPIKDDNDVRKALMELDIKKPLAREDQDFIFVAGSESKVEAVGPAELRLTPEEKAAAIPVELEPVPDVPPDAQFWKKEEVSDEQFQLMLKRATPAQRAEYEKTGMLVVADMEANRGSN